jgi:hypothetical protein
VCTASCRFSIPKIDPIDLNKLESLEMDLEATGHASQHDNTRKLLTGVEELHTYVERNQAFIPNYSEPYRNGERIASAGYYTDANDVARGFVRFASGTITNFPGPSTLPAPEPAQRATPEALSANSINDGGVIGKPENSDSTS